MPAGNAYPSGHLVPSPIVGLACDPIVETRFLELFMSLLDFSPRITLGTFSILLSHKAEGCSNLKRSVDMTSSGKNGLNIRTNASPKWDRTRCPEE